MSVHFQSIYRFLVKDRAYEGSLYTHLRRQGKEQRKPYGMSRNANGLLRQYFPKGMKLLYIAIESVTIAIDKLNSRPRKCLGYKTPYKTFFEKTVIDVRVIHILRL